MDLQELKISLLDMEKRLDDIKDNVLRIESKKIRLDEIDKKLSKEEVWSDLELSQKLSKEKTIIEKTLISFEEVSNKLSDSIVLLELSVEENDDSSIEDILKEANGVMASIEEFEFSRMFSNKMDPSSAYVEIQSGSGGTEAQDWAEMLLRMYTKWSENKGFSNEIVEISHGDIAGIKSASLYVNGDHAYGWLRTETGIHRLVRKSPFDSGNRRHTSFASVFISPEIDDSIEIDINKADLRVDTYRASGAGGQHVNKTDSAIRLTHLPSGLVVECQDDRSQHKNKAKAMTLLSSKLKALEEEQQVQSIADERKILVGTGDRSEKIRTYNFPQGRITDHRIKLTQHNLDQVMDGDIKDISSALLTEHQLAQLADLETDGSQQ